MKINEKRALVFIFITVLLDSIGLGIIVPVMPELIMELTGEGLSRASTYAGWLVMVFALMQLVFAPVVGNLSDRFGRRPVLLISLFIYGLDYVVMGLAPTLAWLFLGRVLSGITGATYGTANAYIADVSSPSRRAQNFGLLGAGFGLGFIIGPVLGGLMGQLGPRAPFFGAAAFALVNVLYGLFVLPESLPVEKRRPFEWAKSHPLGALIALRNYPAVVPIAAVMFLWQLGHQVYPSTWSFFTMERFGWSEAEIGYSLGFVGLSMVLVQGYLTRLAIPRFGAQRTSYYALVVGVASFAGFAFVTTAGGMYALIAISSLSGVLTPSLRGIMSNQVPADSQGALQGALGSVVGLTAILGPLLMTQLFGYFTADGAPAYFPGVSFAAASALSGLALLVFAAASRGVPTPTDGS